MGSGAARVVSGRTARRAGVFVALAALLMAEMGAAPQRRGFGRRGGGWAISTPFVYDGAFVFCRLSFSQSVDGDGGGWSVDYPKSDLNFPFRLGELTETRISRDSRGEPNHVIVSPTDPNLFKCPFVMMTEPGGAFFSDEDAARLREYLEKGGFIWADDFWGEYAWAVWEREIRKVLPAAEYPLRDLPMSHPLFSISYAIPKVPQIPSISHWFGSGFQTSERRDSRDVHVRGIENARGDVIVLATHNTDFGDAFEREGEDRRYFDAFAANGYAFGVNVFLYAMTH